MSLVPAIHLLPLVKSRNNESSPKLPFYTGHLIVSSILCLFFRTLHATRLIRSFSAGNDILQPVQTQSTKQNGRPGRSSVKNLLCYHFAVCPTSESCSQRCSRRRIMLLRDLACELQLQMLLRLNSYVTV